MVIKLNFWKSIGDYDFSLIKCGLYLSYFCYSALKNYLNVIYSLYIKILKYNYSLYYKDILNFQRIIFS